MSLVSAVITTHNRLHLLKGAIASVLGQSYANIECIVVDDNSNDGTEEFCKSISGIRYIKIKPNESRGGNYARNIGIKAARGKFVAFLDDDDLWLPSKIKKQVKVAEETEAGLVYCGIRREIIDRKGNTSFVEQMPNPHNKGDMSNIALQTICTITSCILADRELITRIGGFDESLRFWQEYDLTIRLAQVTHFDFVSDIETIYRINRSDAQRLTNNFNLWRKSVKKFHDKHATLYKNLNCKGRLAARTIVLIDAAERCKSNRLSLKYIFYYVCSRLIVKVDNLLNLGITRYF